VTDTVRAAGGIVARTRAGDIEVLLVHRPRYDDWTFPKGKLEPDEGDEDGALREVHEETGIRCALGEEIGVTEYADSRSRAKIVRYFAMRPLAGAFRPHDEVDELAWLSREAARDRLTYGRDRHLIDRVPAVKPPLYFVRHASAGKRGAWRGDDRLRPLDERGRNQAGGLVEQLEAAQIDRVVSSPAARCVETVAPLADARALPVEQRDELFEGASESDALALVYALDGSGAALCTHGDVLELLLGEMGKKGSTWVVDVDGNALNVLLVLPPPP
jgi:8-oxo-(d)GTP phosphatase